MNDTTFLFIFIKHEIVSGITFKDNNSCFWHFPSKLKSDASKSDLPSREPITIVAIEIIHLEVE
jgi:hypothetical protein